MSNVCLYGMKIDVVQRSPPGKRWNKYLNTVKSQCYAASGKYNITYYDITTTRQTTATLPNCLGKSPE